MPQARSREWADLDQPGIERLIADSAAVGWRSALAARAAENPFFARRMQDLGLANWHVLALGNRHAAALDIGCGFGSLALGLSDYYDRVVGVDALGSRVRYGTLRAQQDGRRQAAFLIGSGLTLPFASGSFQLATMNGVLEWAGLHAEGRPDDLQRAMLAEARRVLAPDGVLAVAIENRFAMETLVGMPDTHTGVRLAPAVPRAVASVLTQLLTRQPFRTYLYGARGYAALATAAGFRTVQVLDLVSSYNDYDFVVRLGDGASYQFLWRRGAVRTFYRRAGLARRALARLAPTGMGAFGYAYLILAGERVMTVLDAAHPIWAQALAFGVTPGRARFACKGVATGTMAIVTHDGQDVEAIITIGLRADDVALDAALPPGVLRAVWRAPAPAATAAWSADGLEMRVFRR